MIMNMTKYIVGMYYILQNSTTWDRVAEYMKVA